MSAWASLLLVVAQSSGLTEALARSPDLSQALVHETPLATRVLEPQSSASRSTEVGGEITTLLVRLPKRGVTEWRPRVSLTASARPRSSIELHTEIFAEGLVGERAGLSTTGIVRAREAWVQLSRARVDLRVGYGRLAWGRLDEIQPSDVINPIDAAKFFLDGRASARLPVTLVRGRVFLSDRLTIEGVLSPTFRRGQFDELGEESSPFNLINDAVVPANVVLTSAAIERREPASAASQTSGGARLSATIGRVDFSGSVYRGREGFGIISLAVDTPPSLTSPVVAGHLVEEFPRLTMVAGDFETVAGEWAVRGEMAMFTEKTLPGVTRPGPVAGHTFDAGGGFDRRAGAFRVYGAVILHREWSEEDAAVRRADASLVGSLERTFGRDRWLVRLFGVVNPADRSGFTRALASWTARDDVTVEASVGAFLGRGDDSIARFHGRDFASLRATVVW